MQKLNFTALCREHGICRSTLMRCLSQLGCIDAAISKAKEIRKETKKKIPPSPQRKRDNYAKISGFHCFEMPKVWDRKTSY